MAGGTFDKSVGKVRPGTYINFKGTKAETIGANTRGIVVMPLIGHKYGPEKVFIKLTADAPNDAHDKLGYSIYDDNAQMLLIREAFKNASTVIVYIPKAGTKASGSGGGITGTAKYGGTRGNDLSFSIVANAGGGFDITVMLGGETMNVYEGKTDIAAVAAISDPYIDFAATSNESVLAAVAGVSLSGGADGTASNSDVTAFLDAIEGIKFNALCFPSTDATLKTAAKSKIKYLRETIGKTVVGVLADCAADFEGIINVTNSVAIGSTTLTNAQATAWVAGACAAATYVQSLTYKVYEGATSVSGVKTHEQSIAAINNGEFFFSCSDDGKIIVEYDINSLTTISDGKDTSYRKNRVIRVFDTFAESLQINFPPNKYKNTPDDWEAMEGVGRSILKNFADAGAIKNVDYDSDFTVDRELSSGDQTFFNVGLEAIDSSEKIYLTVSTR